ncbi:MAG: hypothetical protein FWD44_05265 [Oscillospiraceae bacterium]|nr:hypothetical protein [Oscillospiraceae bacterium]
MSNITKNLFLALTFLCVIALVVFCIQLIVINSGVEPRQPDEIISGDGPPDGQGNENPGGSESPGGSENPGGGDNEPPTTRPPPQGERREIMLDANNTLVIYARTETFGFTNNDLDWKFNYTGGGNAGLEIRFELLSLNINVDAEMMLNRHTNSTGAEYRGEQSIQGSPVRGYFVTLNEAGVTYEAWLHQLEGSDLAVAFIINYSTNEQRDALYEVLSSIDID